MSIRLCGALAMLAIAPAFAATPINETRPLNGDGEVRIENIKGKIVVRTWAKPQVQVTGSLGKGVEKLEISGDAQLRSTSACATPTAAAAGTCGGSDDSRSEPTDLQVMVPQHASARRRRGQRGRRRAAGWPGASSTVSSVSGNVVVTASSPARPASRTSAATPRCASPRPRWK
jgi:hypothetical protein